MLKVMFVCLGNICRSPLAEAVFNHIINLRGLEKKICAESSGTSNWHIGDPPDPRTIEIAVVNGVKISHSGRQFKAPDLKSYNYILAMDRDNLQEITRLNDRETAVAEILMMRDFDNERSGKDVPDPYYGSMEDFQYVFDVLNESCNNFIDFIIKENNL
jgi:protein-tyrosine phosphatase